MVELKNPVVRERILRQCMAARTPAEVDRAWAAEARAFAAQGDHPDGTEAMLRYAAGKDAEAASIEASGDECDPEAFWRGYHAPLAEVVR